MRMRWAVLAALLACACASAPPREPGGDRELWKQQGCFAHILPEWRHVEAARFEGVVFTAGNRSVDFPIPAATVFLRSWPDGVADGRLGSARRGHAGRGLGS